MTTETGGKGSEHDLASLKSPPRAFVMDLQARWISTVEQFVAASATPYGRESLAKLLKDAQGTVSLDMILKEVREILGEARWMELNETKPGGALGALFGETRSQKSDDAAKGESK